MDNMDKWQELVDICHTKPELAPFSSEYLDTFYWKKKGYLFLKERLDEAFEKLISPYEFGIDQQRFIEKYMEPHLLGFETYVESGLQVLHSMLDILCQIVNQLVVSPNPLEESSVRFSNIINQLGDDEKTPIKQSLENLKNSDEFKYIEAFVNTIKHRKLLKLQYKMNPSEGDELKVKEFHRNGLTFNSKLVGDITDSYANHLYALSDEVFEAIIKYLTHPS